MVAKSIRLGQNEDTIEYIDVCTYLQFFTTGKKGILWIQMQNYSTHNDNTYAKVKLVELEPYTTTVIQIYQNEIPTKRQTQ